MAPHASTTSPKGAVLSVINTWHAALSENSDSDRLVHHLVDHGLVIHLPEHTLRSPDDVRTWHAARRCHYSREQLTVKDATVQLRSPLHADAEVEAVWEGVLANPGSQHPVLRREFTESWSLVWQEGRPKVRLLAVHEWPLAREHSLRLAA